MLTILTFSLLNLLLRYAFTNEYSIAQIAKTLIFPISGTPYWFIKQYLLLMICAPIINTGLANLPIHKVKQSVILLVVALCYMLGTYASYNFLNAFLFYCMGYCLSKCDLTSLKINKWQLILVFTITGLSAVPMNILSAHTDMYKREFSDYENVFAVIGTLSIFLLSAKLKFYNKFINKIATAALGCYLLQDGFFGITYLYKIQTTAVEQNGFSLPTVTLFIGSFIGLWTAAYIVTEINSLWIKTASKQITKQIKKFNCSTIFSKSTI